MERRHLLSRLAALPLLASLSDTGSAVDQQRPLKIMMKSAWGSDDPTKAAFPFHCQDSCTARPTSWILHDRSCSTGIHGREL